MAPSRYLRGYPERSSAWVRVRFKSEIALSSEELNSTSSCKSDAIFCCWCTEVRGSAVASKNASSDCSRPYGTKAWQWASERRKRMRSTCRSTLSALTVLISVAHALRASSEGSDPAGHRT
eukprot:2456790-Rhodomonas_salina.1